MNRAVVEELRSLVQAGRTAEAEQCLRRALQSAPNDIELRGSLAQLLASVGQRDAAIVELEQLVALAPASRPARLLLARLANERGRYAVAEEHAGFLARANARDSEAWCALGFSAFAQGRRRQGREFLERAVSITPGYAVAHRNLAAVLCEQEHSEEALAAAIEAERLGGALPGVLRTRAQALMQLNRLDEAAKVLRGLVAAQPEDSASHRVLAQLAQLRGDEDPQADFRAAARREDASPALRLAFADSLRRSGDLDAAEGELRELLTVHGAIPQFQASLATVLQERGDFAQSKDLAHSAFAAMPGDLDIAETYVVASIATGAPELALPVVEQLRTSRPRDQRWITHRIDIARLRGESEFESWFDPARVTRSYELPAPEELLAELRTVLEARHRHRRHPLDQSLRQGTQTSRNLLVRPEPVVAQLLELFGAATREFVAEMSASLAQVPDHPLLSRGTDAPVLTGCWSVKLNRGGHHVSHIHPEGWLSSAFYLRVPAEVSDVERRAGWLRFGEPRFAIPGLPPTGFVQPQPGRLVLFPSYLWHGTTALAGDEPRLSVAFDAVPASEIR